MIGTGIGALLLVAALAAIAFRWLLEGKHDNSATDTDPDIDYEELDQAEREVRDLDSDVRPDEADEELNDWGPGAPR